MTIEAIADWFQLAAEAMFASVALGEYTLYECESRAMSDWPRVVH